MSIKAQATLRTARLDLVPMGHEHRKFTMQLDMDPEVMKMVAFGRPFTEDEVIQVHTWLMGCATSVPGFGTWAGFAKGEFGGKEGGREMVRYAFEELGLTEVIGETMTINKASQAVMAGCGLNHVETFFNKYDTPPPGIEEGGAGMVAQGKIQHNPKSLVFGLDQLAATTAPVQPLVLLFQRPTLVA
ncbi:hypothetical protein IFM46972_11222 [Aspergillus udagawae]|uniref:N-acetyltransferase domain-containing protein n=1 Tax=Aspergillus udagawae TaxID=91492 RepID=A0A8H3SGA5_9EURO|nr:hypothetical protein IFM46972_11222 [Aspergillus udagawae]